MRSSKARLSVCRRASSIAWVEVSSALRSVVAGLEVVDLGDRALLPTQFGAFPLAFGGREVDPGLVRGAPRDQLRLAVLDARALHLDVEALQAGLARARVRW